MAETGQVVGGRQTARPAPTTSTRLPVGTAGDRTPAPLPRQVAEEASTEWIDPRCRGGPVADALARVVTHPAVDSGNGLSVTSSRQAASGRPAEKCASQAWMFSPPDSRCCRAATVDVDGSALPDRAAPDAHVSDPAGV